VIPTAPLQQPCYHCTCSWMACSWSHVLASKLCSRPTVKWSDWNTVPERMVWSEGLLTRAQVWLSKTQYLF
jgi:hypothetical protein